MKVKNNGVEIYEDILDKKQLEMFRKLAFTKKQFFLAGGTALALQIGHRKSIDFDFFTNKDFDVDKMITKLKEIWGSENVLTTMTTENSTLNAVVDGVKISFFKIPYPPVEKLIELHELNMATKLDIACMKCHAITRRSVKKDYIDLYFLLKEFSLREILDTCAIKYESLSYIIILKSLQYFDEVKPEGVTFLRGQNVSFEEVKSGLTAAVKKFDLRG